MVEQQCREVSGAPLIVVLGPTAIGKTGLAIELARALNGEIIGADSRQIYRHMDIGTAKPTPEQRAAIPHYLLDMVEPDDQLAVAQYQKMAYKTIDAISRAGRIPFLVGGTGQYITAVVEGWAIPEVPPNPSLRLELEAFAASHGALALYERLKQEDPAAAARIDPYNVRRVVRALEVCTESGQRFSELKQKMPPPYSVLQYGLTMERNRLYEVADTRVDHMIEQGFVTEVQRLLQMGYSRSLPSMSGLGYRQLAAHLLDGVPLEEAVVNTKHATHDFIRRQYTWFRGHDTGILWHNRPDVDVSELIRSTSRWLEEHT